MEIALYYTQERSGRRLFNLDAPFGYHREVYLREGNEDLSTLKHFLSGYGLNQKISISKNRKNTPRIPRPKIKSLIEELINEHNSNPSLIKDNKVA